MRWVDFVCMRCEPPKKSWFRLIGIKFKWLWWKWISSAFYGKAGIEKRVEFQASQSCFSFLFSILLRMLLWFYRITNIFAIENEMFTSSRSKYNICVAVDMRTTNFTWLLLPVTVHNSKRATRTWPCETCFMFYECDHSICKIKNTNQRKTSTVVNNAQSMQTPKKNDVCARAFKYSVYIFQ